MRFMRLGPVGSEIPVVRDGDRYLDLRSITDDIDGAFLSGSLDMVRQALASGDFPKFEPADGIRIGAPIARPMAVVCIGQNYAAHAAESGDAPPAAPIVFFKHPNTVIGPFDDVPIPPGATKVDWEVELGIVIGQRASYLPSHEAALEHVAGYVVSNDVSERAYQIEHSGGQWSKGKCAPGFNPVGPELVTADEVDGQALRLWSTVNGEPRQDSSTADMVFSIAQIVHDLSQYMTLEPGDLINTGTPQGVAISGRFPYLVAGDVMEISIEGLGAPQRQHLVAHAAAEIGAVS